MHPSLAFQKAKRAQRRQKLEQELDCMLPLLKAWGVQKVILFKLRMTSDLDLLVVMETSKRFLDRLDELYGLLDPKIALDLLVYYTQEEFYRLRETSPLVRRAIAEGRVNPKFEELGRQVAPLDQYYIPTCYPNGLPGGVPFEAYNIKDGQRALRLASRVLDAVQERLSINDVTET